MNRHIKRHRRRRANGEERTYYGINGTERSLGSVNSSSVSPNYREKDFARIVAGLQANCSMLIVGEAGSGKSAMGELVTSELEELGFLVASTSPTTTKQVLVEIADQLGVDMDNLEGKKLTILELQQAIADFLSETSAIFICDDAHRLSPGIRYWLEKLYDQGQPMLLITNYPPARDIFLKLPRMELKPLSERSIREIMQSAASKLGLELSNAQLAHLQQRCGGNPMLAERVIREEHLGLDDEQSPDHTQWMDGTNFLIAALMLLVIIRFLGLGFNSTSLYLIGGILTVAVAVVRILLYSLPRKSGRLGK